MPRVKEQTLIVLPQITIRDLLNEIEDRNLDVADLLKVAEPELDYVPDVASDPLTLLVRALLEVGVPDDANLSDWLEVYDGVGPVWLEIVTKLRLRGAAGASALVHPAASGRTATHQRMLGTDGSLSTLRYRVESGRSVLLQPFARTLGLELRRAPAPAGALTARAPQATNRAELDTLADVVVDHLRDTIGAAAFLRNDPQPAALAVLAATVAAVLHHPSSRRTVGDDRFVRFDVYQKIFEALDLVSCFEVARRFLEADRPAHVPIRGPWPPGISDELRSIAILRRHGDRLELLPEARLEDVGGEILEPGGEHLRTP